MSISLQMWTYPILITLLCVCLGGGGGYLQQKSRLHYQGDMGLFLILVDCSNPFDVLSPPRQKEGYIEMFECTLLKLNFHIYSLNL